MGHDQPVIIVKKKQRGHEGHHGGAWKVAYADFVTAMMAFFLVMWLVGQSKSVRGAVGGYFRDPGIFEQQRSNGPIPGGNGGILPDGVPKTTPEQEAEVREALKQAAERIHDELAESSKFGALRDQVEISLTEEGLRVQLLETTQTSFFDSGSSILKNDAVQLLRVIGEELAKQPNQIAIEGHTDSRPFSRGTDYTNWELSADRANAARRIIEPLLRPRQLAAVRGYADTQLRTASDPIDSRNRRVTIVVRNSSQQVQQ